MKNGKYQNGASKRILVLALALVLLLGCGIGGTIAWLMDTTDAVTNTFTVGDINIDLTETDNDYQIIPGDEDSKDPKVTVEANSENCWVFVQVQEVNNTVGDKKYVTWTIADGWTVLETDNGVTTYYKEYAGAEEAEYAVLKDNKVTYDENLTKEDIEGLYTEGTTTIDTSKQPKLIFKAFAVQKEAADSAAAAWDEINAAEKLPETAPTT